ncbi:CD4+ T-cell-stimulating antigen [Paenibacillus swuensis]|uniref:CD4+ T-cell-stimulating antigen n=1 Tax=Paenibacillus swuensis TaxID=1178515 RepID=A0A172TK29_9BACL|nr:BMP family ABC transporter substrate-binding protein [Paenibacillus swuensis]ANE47419.1 CD4+ T-cell-stimulating antigen [Paenibacillus swuensis]
MKKWTSLTLVAIIALVLVLSGCGKDNNGANEGKNTGENAGNAGNAPKSDIKVGLVTDSGGVNDKSFNQSAWEGLEKVGDSKGVETKYLESKSDPDYIPNLNKFVKDGYSLTWGIGFLMGDAIKKVATDNPEAKLAIIDNAVEAPNVASVTFAEHEGSYLVGIVAGLTTKTNKIGFVGGMEIPVITRFEKGFVAGVKEANPNAEVLINYVGDFGKPDAGKAAAATMYDNGADIIFHAAGATGNGVFNEATDRSKSGSKVWVIGVDKDQSLEFGEEVTLTSMMKRVDTAVETITTQLVDGEFPAGKIVTLGLKDDGVGLPENNKNVAEDVLKKVEDYKAKIISGDITVPAE